MRLYRPLSALAAVAVLAACHPTAVPAERDAAESPAEPVAATDATAPTQATPQAEAAATNETPQGKRAAGEENLPMNAWRAFGNEPFWSVRLEGDTLVFSTPENQAGTTLKGRRVPSLIGVVYMGTDGDGREFNLDIQPGQCSDGMSDNTYQHVATFIYGETTYRGCAESAK